MRRSKHGVAMLAMLLLLAPAVRADDEKTAEEMEQLAKEAMEEAQKMLDQAKARREARAAAEAAEAAEAAAEQAAEAAEQAAEAIGEAVAPPIDDQVTPKPLTEAETPRERKLRLREERRAEKERIRTERIRSKERIRLERLRARESIYSEKLRIRSERLAQREQIRAERRAAKERVRAERLAAKQQYWATHKRPRFYLNFMVLGGALTEDDGNRVTSRDSETLEGAGGAFRVGAVIKDHHLMGVRMQALARPTRSVLAGDGTTTNDWGLVADYYVGPDYRYITDFGLYFGLSVGVGALVAEADFEDHGKSCDRTCRTCSTRCAPGEDDEVDEHRVFDEHAAISIGGVATLGYELRLSRYFALYAEAFGGYQHGLDQDERTMNNAMFGIAIGLGI